MRIGLDAMGGDFAPKSTIEGALLALTEIASDDIIVLFGDRSILEKELEERNATLSRFEIVHAPEKILTGDQPSKVLVQKPNSSIALGYGYLKAKKIDSFCSAGHSGAMMVGAIYVIGLIEGIMRPCITNPIPKEDGGIGILLDAGINSDVKPELLQQFGIIGSLYAQHVHNIKTPRIGLVNIGHEEDKGNLLSLAAHKLMSEDKEMNFVGNVEPRDFFKDKADVMVCDGFTGNIILKLSETLFRTFAKRFGADDPFLSRFNYENYGGTPILGIDNTVLLGHGISNGKAIKSMLLFSKHIFNAGLVQKIAGALKN
ncbi:MAG: phosphate--acyl-ACP acyltransferase [Bacteroidota bacterium]